MLTYTLPQKPPRTTSRILGRPIHPAVGNRQRRSDHYAWCMAFCRDRACRSDLLSRPACR